MDVVQFPHRLSKSQVAAIMHLQLLDLEKLAQEHPDRQMRKHARREIQEIKERLLEYEHAKRCEILLQYETYDARGLDAG